MSEEKILSGTVGNYAGDGWGSVSVADGRAYCSYVAPRPETIDTRTLTKEALARLGWNEVSPPDDLLAKIEQARVSDERGAIKDGRELAAWINDWLKTRLDTDAGRKCRAFVTDRLKRGASALPLDVLDRLATIADKPFPNQAALEAWFAENGIEAGLRKAVQAVVPTTDMYRDTVVICLDAATGKTVWKKVLTGGRFYSLYENAAASSTPCIANGKVYLLGTLVEAFCLDARTGEKIWSSRIGTMPKKDAHSSFIVVDGVAAACGEPFTGFDAESGKVLWSHDLDGYWSSPVLWQKDGKAYLIARVGGAIVCVEARSGKILWRVKDVSRKAIWTGITPVVEGDRLLIADEHSMRLFRLSLEKAEQLWQVSCPVEICCSPTIYRGYAYIFAGRRGATCVNIETGKVSWKDPSLKSGMYHTPLIADGKVLLHGDGLGSAFWGDGSLCMIAVSPEKGAFLGRAKIGQELCASAAVVDGRIYCRLKDRIACYDLRAQQN